MISRLLAGAGPGVVASSDGWPIGGNVAIGTLLAGSGGPVSYADTLSVGAYAISGRTVSDSVVRADSLSVGAYAISGKTVTDVLAKNDALAKGTYSIAGQNVTDSAVRADSLSKGTYTYVGKDVTDVVTTGGIAYADNLSAGAYAIAGKTVTDSITKVDALSVGAYIITGKTVTDSKVVADSMPAGAYALAGKAITDAVGRQDALAKGSYVYTGNDLTDVKTGATAYADNLQAGAYVITGYSLSDALTQTSTKHGGDDAFHPHKHTGWNKKNWQKKQLRDDAIESTIEETYQKIMGIAPAPEVISEIKREARTEIKSVDYTQEQKFIAWLSNEIAQIKQYQLDIEDDDEDAMMLLMD